MDCFSMNSAHTICGIDFDLIQQVSRRVCTKRNKLKVTYCADFLTKQQLIAEKIIDGLNVQICCDLNMKSGSSFNVLPLEDKFFELLEAKYHEMH